MDGRRLADVAERLACPWCGANGLDHQGDDVTAALRCAACGRTTSVVDGVWQAMGPHRAPSTPAQLVNRLPLTAHVYERWWRLRSLSLLSGRPFPAAEELAELEAAVAPKRGQVIVDVACSEGLYGRHLAGAGAVVLAVDHARPFLEAARRRAAAGGVALVAVQAPAQHLPIATGGADAVVMGGSLNEIGDRGAAAGEMARVTTPGGRGFSMSLTRAASRRGRLLQATARPAGIAFPTAQETEAMFTTRGFDIVSRRSDGVVVRLTLIRR